MTIVGGLAGGLCDEARMTEGLPVVGFSLIPRIRVPIQFRDPIGVSIHSKKKK